MADNFKEIKEFLDHNEDDIKPLLETNNFEAIYMYLYSEINHDKLTGQFTELMFNLGINPLDYMSLVPPHFLYQTSISAIVIPKHISDIDSYAFYYAYHLKKIIFENGSRLTNVGYRAFLNCFNIEEITFPPSVIEIYDDAFNGCKNLKRIYVSENTEISNDLIEDKKIDVIRY